MRLGRIGRYWWVAVLLLGLAVWVWREVAQRGSSAEAIQRQLNDTIGISRIVLSRGGERLQLTRDGEQRWIVNDSRAASADQVRALLSLLSSLHLEVPAGESRPDSAFLEQSASGLGVEIEYAGGRCIAYSVAVRPDGGLLLEWGGGDKCYIATLLGYESTVFDDLSLEGSRWCTSQLGVAIPSDLQSVELQWAQDTAWSFYLELQDKYSGTLYRAPHDATPLPYDTASVATFLYALTNLSATPLPDSAQAEVRAQIERQPPFLEIVLERNEGLRDTLALYGKVAETSTGCTDGSAGYSANHAYLRGNGRIYQVTLSQWDAAMPLRDDLMPR